MHELMSWPWGKNVAISFTTNISGNIDNNKSNLKQYTKMAWGKILPCKYY